MNFLRLDGLKELREIEVRPCELLTSDLEASVLEGPSNILLLVKISPGGLGGSREELAKLLEPHEPPCLGSERKKNPPIRQTTKMLDHTHHLVGGVVDGDIDACHGVVVARDGLEVGGVELRIGDPHLLGPAVGLRAHGVADVARADVRPHLSERNGEAPHAAAAVAHALSFNVTVGLDPVDDLLDGLIVSRSNVELHAVDLVALGIDLIPAVEALSVEVFADLRLQGGESEVWAARLIG